MSEPRLYAARFSAQSLLKRIWHDRAAVVGSDVSVESLLLKAPQYIVEQYLGLKILNLAFYPGNADVAGFLERDKKLVGIVNTGPVSSQRFTLAHEIGHYMLHTNALSFRDRSLSAPDSSGGRPAEEREADAFAAELIIPRNHLKRVFYETFGDPLDSDISDIEFAEAMQMSGLKRQDVFKLKGGTPLFRAQCAARLKCYRGKSFSSLIQKFNASPTALGIQLLHCGLVH